MDDVLGQAGKDPQTEETDRESDREMQAEVLAACKPGRNKLPRPRMAGLEPLHRRRPDETLPPPDDVLDELGAMRDEPPRQEYEPRHERDKQERGSKRIVGCHVRDSRLQFRNIGRSS